jgi:hypothetical protein
LTKLTVVLGMLENLMRYIPYREEGYFMADGPARDLGIFFNDHFIRGHCTKGRTNSIVDVAGVRVGHANFMFGKYYVNNTTRRAGM